MNKIHTKLLVFLGAVICSLCLVFGLSACANNGGNNTNEDDNGGDGHTHTFGDLWLPDGDEGHYQLATCHPTVKSELEDHVDENDNEICDVCDYNMHVHTYAEELSFDQESHWYAATCSHNLTKDQADHDFVDGVCECGVTEDEVAVYAMYKAAEGSGAYAFAIWLESLKNDGVTEIKVADSGDALYYYGDTFEVAYFAARTVTANATAGGEPLAHVWFSIQLQAKENITIAAVETDENGEAVITFTPVSYSGDNNTYVLRIPEAKDIPGNNDESILPIPRKYTASTRTVTLEIDENALETTVFAYSLTLSNDWSDDAVKDVHPYDRTYTDLGDDTSEIVETNKNWTIEKTTGNGYMDYFNFEPYTIENYKGDDLGTRNTNAKKAAQGNYKLSFATESDAEVYLVYWNYNLSMGGFKKNEDKSPADEYIGSISGVAPQGSAIEKKYTGENYVIVRISEELAASVYYLGLYTEKSCSVTISVERIGDYEEEQDELNALGIGEENMLTDIEVPYARTVTIPLKSEVVAGRYMLTVKMKGFTPPANYAYATIEGVRYYIYRSTTGTNVGEFKGIIEIPEGTNKFTLGTLGTSYNCDLTLEKYEVEIAEEKTAYYVPVTADGAQVAIDTATFAGKKANIKFVIITTNITDAPTVTVKNPDGSIIGTGTASLDLMISGKIAEGAEYLTFEVDGSRGFTAYFSVETVKDATGEINHMLITIEGGADTYAIITFTAKVAGDYIITVDKHEDMELSIVTLDIFDTYYTGKNYLESLGIRADNSIETRSSEPIHLEEGEELVLYIVLGTHRNITVPDLFKFYLTVALAD